MNIYIASAKRSPIGKYLGALRDFSTQNLLSKVIQGQMELDGVLKEEDIEILIAGNVIASGEAPNVARDTLLEMGMENVPAYSLNMMCGSGLQAVINGAFYATNSNKAVISAGVESLSRAPYVLPFDQRFNPKKLGDFKVQDTNLLYHYNAQPIDKYGKMHMGNTAENIVNKYSITREECDYFALESQMRYDMANKSGRFKKEIIPISSKETIIDKDEHPRSDTTIDKLKLLKPAFAENGIHTAGNSSGLNDGAASIFLMNKEQLSKRGFKSTIFIKDFSNTGVSPNYMGLGPAFAIKDLLNKNQLSLEDIGLIEINEAFSGQVLGVFKELGIDQNPKLTKRVNPNGGAIALGHPLGMSGSRLVGTVKAEMELEGHKYGIASACIGGGMGIAILLENDKL